MLTVLRQSLTGKILFECHEVKYVIKYDNFQKGPRTANGHQAVKSKCMEGFQSLPLTLSFTNPNPMRQSRFIQFT